MLFVYKTLFCRQKSAADVGHLVCPLPDGQHASAARSQKPSGDDLLRPAKRGPHHWVCRRQDPQQSGLPDHGADTGILCASAG